MRTLKHLAVVAVMVGLATPVYAVYYPGSTDFEGESPLEGTCWGNVGDAAVVTDESVTNVVRSSNLPPSFDKTRRKNVLEVDADEAIVRKLMADDTAAAASTIYADFLINPLPITEDEGTPEAGDEDKILIYTRVNQSGNATNLCVYAKDAVNGTAQEFVLTKTFGADEWHRIVVKATAEGYQVYCDGTDAANLCKTSGDVDTFYALSSGTPVTSVGFVGAGHVDDIILTDFDPALPVTTLTWDDSLVSVSYTVNGEPGDALTPSDGSYACQIPAGATVVMTGDNGFRSFSTTGTTLETPTGLAYYTADASGSGTSADPYTIPSYGALVAMQQAVAADASFRSAHYVQTADIDGTGKAAFAGIGTYEKVPTAGTPFTGTYDGQGHTIANITRAGGNTQGIFNQVGVGGVVENLVVSNMVFASDVSGEYGFAIVGNAGGGATLRNLTAAGVFGAADKPSTHNVAGIVVRLSPGATADVATTIDSCTNNATIYGAYTKLGGICAIVQNQTGFKDGKVVFVNCANNGALVCKRTSTGVTGNAGIVGYIAGTNVELTGCYGNGAITNEDGANTDKDGALVGNTNSGTIKDNGGNSAPSDKKMIGTWGGATETGFQYATVENGVATTIVGAPIAGGEYLLEGNAAPVIALDDGDTIAFDTALGYTLDDTGITAAEGLVVSSSTSGFVTTFTADTPKVAQIGNNKYDSVAEAVAAAQSGDTVELLADVTLDARVEPNVGANTSLTIDLGGHTITREGTSGNGSVFDVKSGNVVITNGVIDCTQDDTDIAKDGVYAITSRSGSNVTLADLDITVDSECGACAYPFAGSTMTIESGTYANITTTPYRYNTAITGMAVNQPNDATQYLIIKGGSFSQYDPQLGDDSGAMTDFTDDGFVAIDDGNGHFVVQTGYNVTFDANGGTPAPEAQRVATGGTAEEPAAPTKDNYVFAGWTLNGSAYDFDTVLSEDITLVAQFDPANPPSYNDPEGNEIGDPAIVGWLAANNFAQADINALGDDAAASERLYECYLLNCSIKGENLGGALSNTAIAVTNGVISITVQLDRNSPLGFINGVLHIYGTDDLADDFSLISEESIVVDGDSTFETVPAEGVVTQSVTATFSLDDVSATFFKVVIEFPEAEDSEDPWEEPWEDTEE